MASQAPYSINLDTKFGPLELIDLDPLVKACQDKWYNQTLCKVNDCVVRLGIMQGEFHWHKHDNEDEFFYVVDGRFLIDLEDRTVELMPKQGFTSSARRSSSHARPRKNCHPDDRRRRSRPDGQLRAGNYGYFSLAYSDFAAMRIGMSGSASFQRAKKS